jgi:hypothetical protein
LFVCLCTKSVAVFLRVFYARAKAEDQEELNMDSCNL